MCTILYIDQEIRWRTPNKMTDIIHILISKNPSMHVHTRYTRSVAVYLHDKLTPTAGAQVRRLSANVVRPHPSLRIALASVRTAYLHHTRPLEDVLRYHSAPHGVRQGRPARGRAKRRRHTHLRREAPLAGVEVGIVAAAAAVRRRMSRAEMA